MLVNYIVYARKPRTLEELQQGIVKYEDIWVNYIVYARKSRALEELQQ